MIEWTSKISKGNSKGTTGLVYMPKRYRDQMGYDAQLKVIFEPMGLLDVRIEIHSNLKKTGGFYIPQKYIREYGLIGEQCKVRVEISEYHEVKVQEKQSFRVPNDLVDKFQIENGDIIECEIKVKDEVYSEISRVYTITRKNRHDETIANLFTPKLRELSIIRFALKRILKKPVRPKDLKEGEVFIPNLFPEAQIGLVDATSIIIFDGKAAPIITPLSIQIQDFIHYMGCYMADGTKIGPGWSINASTFQQANYYLKRYHNIVLNSDLRFNLIYTKRLQDKRSNREIEETLFKMWKLCTSLGIKIDKIKIRPSSSDFFRKWNQFGSLRIRDHRGTVVKLHIKILKKIKDFLKKTPLQIYKWKYLFGILEGDGDLSGGKSRIGIRFSTVKSDDMIQLLLTQLNITYCEDHYKNRIGGKGLSISFNLVEILKNLDVLYRNVFNYYPKRRNKFLYRVTTSSTAQCILGLKEVQSNFVSKIIEDNNLKDEKTKSLLKKMVNELKK